MYTYDFNLSFSYMSSFLTYWKGQDTESQIHIHWSQVSDTAGMPGRSKGSSHSRGRFPQMQDVFLSTAWHLGRLFLTMSLSSLYIHSLYSKY